MRRTMYSFFQLTVLLVFALSIHSQALRKLHEASKPTEVIIVGAGMAGIMAGKTLSEAGIKDFVILEATDRIGGRMREANFAGKRIELGANWVEGVNKTTKNPIWHLANKYKLKTFFSRFDNLSHNIYTQKGPLDGNIGEKRLDKAESGDENIEDYSLGRIKANSPDMSVLSAQKLLESPPPTTPLDMVLDYYLNDYEFAEPPSVTSLKNTQPNPTFFNFGDENHLVADQRGYSFLVVKLAEDYLSSANGSITDSRLHLNQVVRQIKYSKTGVTATTEDGSTYTAKYIIVTVSLGVLQSDLIKFIPSLPEWKREALSEFDMAVYTKIFLKFPYKFWPSKGPLTEFFLYADERRGYYPIWQHLENEFPGSNVMFVTVTDMESRRIELQSDNETKAEIFQVLKNMFGKNVPEPQDILVPRWWSNRFFVGSFSNWPIGVEDYEFKRIQAPLEHTLYFAGEHTHDNYNGYVHGAYFSGIDTANKLLECLKKKKCSDKVPEPPAHRTGDKRRRNMENNELEAEKKREFLKQEFNKKRDQN